MLTNLFLTINDWITGATALAALGCFLWGMVSVLLSPCHLASIPLVVAYVAGQEQALKPRQAAHYAVFFTAGLFITIAVIGIVCALLGRMLGDVGSYWQIVVGLILIWVALGMLGVEKCTLSGSLAAPAERQGAWRRVPSGIGLRRPLRLLHVRFHRPDPRDHHGSAEGDDGRPADPPVCLRPLPSHRHRRQLHGGGPAPDGERGLDRIGGLVPQERRGRHRPAGGLFHRQSFLNWLSPTEGYHP